MKRILALAVIPLFFASCVPPELTGDTYSRQDIGGVQTVKKGRVTSVRYVKLQGGSAAGPLVGAVAGGIVGNTMGGGRGNTLATLAGVGLGAAAGNAIEQKATNRQGVEIEVRLDGGESIVVTQENTDRETFYQGDRVRVIMGGGRTRVTH